MSEKQALTNPATEAFAELLKDDATLWHSHHALKCLKESKQNVLLLSFMHKPNVLICSDKTCSSYGYVCVE